MVGVEFELGKGRVRVKLNFKLATLVHRSLHNAAP